MEPEPDATPYPRMDPKTRARRVEHAWELQRSLSEAGIQSVVITSVDNAGITLYKTIPVARLESAVARGIGIPPVFDAFLIDDSIVPTSPLAVAHGDLRWLPDPFALRVLAAQPGWAWAPVDKYLPSGDVFGNCQRTFARSMEQRAKDAGLDVLMAFEIECFVGLDDETAIPAHPGPAYSTTRFTQMAPLIKDIMVALETQELGVGVMHSELGQGQLEVSVRASTPVAAADAQVVVRQTIRAVVAAHGLRVSFAPVVILDEVGNGGHLHYSLWRDGDNLHAPGGSAPGGMQPEGAAFTAGVLEHLPALLSIGCPSAASYLRLVPGRWAGAFGCWGIENREVALRFVASDPDGLYPPESANIEVKCFDASANPYLAVGAVLAAGLDGIERKLELPPPVGDDPAALTSQERRERGIVSLPGSLGEAVWQLERSEMLRAAMGAAQFDGFLAVRRGEAELFGPMTPQEIVAAHLWKY
ncbi:MAG: glutamine synthetase [Gaiellales bacterium]|nr:glutamine synthetase [Gaiellales bacterium]